MIKLFQPPPLVTPICSSCKVMAERWTILPTSDHLRVRMIVQCHGKTAHHSDDANLAIRRKWTIVKFSRPTFNAVNMKDPIRA